MDNYNINYSQSGTTNNVDTVTKSFISNVFSYMGLGLTLSAIVAYVFGTDMSYMRMLVSETGMTGLGYIVMFAPIGFVFAMSLGFQRMSSTVMLLLFLAYSIVMGMSLSFIFIAYTHGSIFQTFGIAALTFGVMAVMGYTTKTDLTKFGSILIMALVGIIIASLVNMFLHSSQMDYIISFIGVLIFTGLTAYDVQKLKRIGAGVEMGTDDTTKLAIFGALTLYLDFINLFLFLLRFFGNRKS